MKASVIICTFNRAESLSRTLESLLCMAVSPELEWEVLIVDNNSTDSTKSVSDLFQQEFPGRFRYIFEGRQGKSFALNTAIDAAKGEILAFTDDDVTMDAQWLAQIISTMENCDCLGVGGRILPVWNVSKPDWLQMEGPHRLMPAVVSFDLGNEMCQIHAGAFGANMAFRRNVFETYGRFRADLGPTIGSEMRGEDTEFCRRLIKAKERLIYAPHAIVFHPVEKRRIEKAYFQAWYFGRGRASIRESGVPASAIRYFGVPRYLIASLSRKLLRWTFCFQPKQRFYHKLQVYETLGQIVEARKLSSVGKQTLSSRVSV
jgi:glucosyl-dolichyl phosphate glucuronosyltransferase